MTTQPTAERTRTSDQRDPRLIRLRWRWPKRDIADGLRMDRIPPDALELMFAVAEGREPWPMLLTGVFGCGKTSAAKLLSHHAIGGRYWTLKDFHKLTYQDGAEDPWDGFRAAGVAVIDKVGNKGKASDGESETLESCLDAREFAPLILVSNRSLEELDELYGGAIASRMMAGTRITEDHFGDTDQRWPVAAGQAISGGKVP